MPETIEAKELQLGNIFSDAYRFEIPEYQRPYSWTTEQTEELFDDLRHAIDGVKDVSKASPYFLGSIVIIKENPDGPLADIVDGQQRITTLTILFCALRDLASQDKGAINVRVCAPGDKFADIPGHFRLTIGEKNKKFFQKNIQEMGNIAAFVERSHANLPDSQQRIFENTAWLWKSLKKLDENQRDVLMKFLVQRCYLVVVATSNHSSAYRIFSVLNDRGLDLSPTDILKAEIIGPMKGDDLADFTKRWEDIEEDLGRDDFRDLFAHIRMIHMKSKLRGTLQQEFQDNVLKKVGKARFIDDELEPYAEEYEIVTRATYRDAADSEKGKRVNEFLRYLNELDNFDWIPPAMAFFKRNKNDTDALVRFIWYLERLAYGMFIRRANINQRINRYGKILRAIEKGKELFQSSSLLRLSSTEKSEILNALDGPIYSQTRVRSPLLLRLDSLLADGTVRYDYSKLTIEHVLPQNPKRGSQWRKDFPDKDERTEWAGRLANLVLLPRSKNSQAGNLDFDEKKKKYFQSKKGVVTFALTSQVLSEVEWTPKVLEKRQKKLIEALKKEWRLA